VVDAQIDHSTGLFMLRESSRPLEVWCTDHAHEDLTHGNPIFRVLAGDVVTRQVVARNEPFALPGDLGVELFSVPGKVALYLEDDDPALAAETGANVGVEVACGDRRLLYVPGAAAVNADLRQRLDRADVVLLDAPLFVEDELILTGTGDKTGRRMGHMPLDGADGTLAALGGLRGRRILTHINNTNPILIEGSAERRKVEAAGFEVAEDGMEIVL
jgi:pyrroloquinoline quinone biosynthesis protein B